jgi:hypothetical protein
MLKPMKTFKLNCSSQKLTWILVIMFFCVTNIQAQSTQTTEVVETPLTIEQLPDSLKPGPKFIKKLGDYTVMEEEGIKVVYDPKGIPLLLRAEDFERIYLEEVAKKKSE